MAEIDPFEPMARTAAQEEEDRATAVQNMLDEAYLDWPNQAGFDHLTEHRGPVELAVKGVIPAWAAGSLFRNGPGARKIENTKSLTGEGHDGTVFLSHWFDGIAHIHRFDIVASDTAQEQVRVFYSSRRQADDLVRSVQEKGSLGGIITFGQRADPCVGIFGKAMSCFRALNQGKEAAKYDNLNVTILPALRVPALESCGTDDGKADGAQASERQRRVPPLTAAMPRGNHGGNTGKKVWIASDTSILRVIDATTLEPHRGSGVQRQSALHPLLKGAMSCAHLQRCPKTGDVFNYNIEPGQSATYRIFRVSAATGQTDILATLSRSNLPPAYIHSFFLSERFVVLRVPTTHFGKRGLSIPWQGNLIDAIEPFDASKPCRWFFIDRIHSQGLVAECETPAGFFFHSVNAWDEVVPAEGTDGKEDDRLVDVFCDVVDFPNTDIIHKLYYDVLLNIDGQSKKAYASKAQITNAMSSLVRWKFRIPLPSATSSPSPALVTGATASPPGPTPPPARLFSIPSPHSGELPTIHPAFHTRRHRYVYGLPQTGRSALFTAVVKTDTVRREARQWAGPAGHTPGEAVFVPRPGGTAEDDGVLLSVVLDGHAEKSYLVCIDARTMQETGRAAIDFAVAFGLHGVHDPA